LSYQHRNRISLDQTLNSIISYTITVSIYDNYRVAFSPDGLSLNTLYTSITTGLQVLTEYDKVTQSKPSYYKSMLSVFML